MLKQIVLDKDVVKAVLVLGATAVVTVIRLVIEARRQLEA